MARFGRDLERRFACSGIDRSSYLLEVSPGPAPRLRIDGDALVEFDGERRCYRIVVQTSDVTRVILETSDFGNVDKFVCQYIVDQFAESTARAFTS